MGDGRSSPSWCPCGKVAVVIAGRPFCAACAGDEIMKLRMERIALRNDLQTYGAHKWKCAISRQLRADVRVTAECDCEWQETARRLMG